MNLRLYNIVKSVIVVSETSFVSHFVILRRLHFLLLGSLFSFSVKYALCSCRTHFSSQLFSTVKRNKSSNGLRLADTHKIPVFEVS